MNERNAISIDPSKGPQISYTVKDFDYRDASEESWVRLGYLIDEMGLSYPQAIEVLEQEYRDVENLKNPKNTDLTSKPK